jgi:hypothetical protein
MSLTLEMVQQDYGADSPTHRDAFTFWDRCTCGFAFIAKYGKPESKLIHSYTWNPTVADKSESDLRITKEYTSFLNMFPRWHRDVQAADVLADGRIRFALERDSPGQRRVIAFQQRFRPSIGMQDAATHHRMQLNPAQEQKFADLYRAARAKGSAKKFKYEPPPDLIEDVMPHWINRVNESFRYPESTELGEYSLGDFKSFYAAFLTLCSIHERLCYPFLEKGHTIPESSMVLVKQRTGWIRKLAAISGLPANVCETMVSHLTLDTNSRNIAGMTVYPFVPLDRNSSELAVAPQFPLAARADENVLRALSYRVPNEFSKVTTQKEGILRARLKDVNTRFKLPEPIRLPDGSTDLDLIIEDSGSNTLVLSELKWIRKPVKALEHIQRDEEVEKGIRQIKTIRNYVRSHPDFLMQSGRLARKTSSYSNIHYLLIVADHWFWTDPEDGFAIIDYQTFLTEFAKSSNLQETVADLISYQWLPNEGQDFYVGLDASSANGAVIEIPTFYHVK